MVTTKIKPLEEINHPSNSVSEKHSPNLYILTKPSPALWGVGVVNLMRAEKEPWKSPPRNKNNYGS